MITHEELKERFYYHPESGDFVRLTTTGLTGNYRTGTQAGSLNKLGYIQICVGVEKYYAHRLAHFYVTGAWPTKQIDHKNLDKADNCWSNIRETTVSQNRMNTRIRANNTSGAKGVDWFRSRQVWRVRVRTEGQVFHVGYFKDLEDAKAARHLAASSLHGAYVRTR